MSGAIGKARAKIVYIANFDSAWSVPDSLSKAEKILKLSEAKKEIVSEARGALSKYEVYNSREYQPIKTETVSFSRTCIHGGATADVTFTEGKIVLIYVNEKFRGKVSATDIHEYYDPSVGNTVSGKLVVEFDDKKKVVDEDWSWWQSHALGWTVDGCVRKECLGEEDEGLRIHS